MPEILSRYSSGCWCTSLFVFFFFSSRRRHTRWPRDWSSDVCSSDLAAGLAAAATSLRSDGALAFATLWLFALASSRLSRRWLGLAAAAYLALVVPYEAVLTWFYGSPIPTTLEAKTVQATIGGWPDYVGGLRDLLGGWVAGSALYWL